MPAWDLLIVGGGVVGLASAYRAAQAGARVLVLERESPGAGASGAAAGILAPHVETGSCPSFRELGLRSLGLWPALAAELHADTGISVELIPSGVVELAADPAHAAALWAQAERRQPAGPSVEWLEPAAVAALAPGLALPGLGALHAPGDMHLEPPRVVAALQAACELRGVTIRSGVEVRRLLTARGQRVTGVESSEGAVRAGAVLLCGGAWSALLAPVGLTIPVFPVKGQILAVRLARENAPAPWIESHKVLFAPGVYCVPKRDGRLVLGATEEPEAGYDRSLTVGGLLAVAGAAARAFPALARATVVSHWSGLRPCTPDRLPMLGPAPGWEGLLVATGHHRNGVLLAPVTGEAVAAWAADRSPAGEWAPFCPGRFSQQAAYR